MTTVLGLGSFLYGHPGVSAHFCSFPCSPAPLSHVNRVMHDQDSSPHRPHSVQTSSASGCWGTCDTCAGTVQALSHSVRALKKLHSTGYVHRDIKPGNILRRPKQHDWTLIDFGCAAEIGAAPAMAAGVSRNLFCRRSLRMYQDREYFR